MHKLSVLTGSRIGDHRRDHRGVHQMRKPRRTDQTEKERRPERGVPQRGLRWGVRRRVRPGVAIATPKISTHEDGSVNRFPVTPTSRTCQERFVGEGGRLFGEDFRSAWRHRAATLTAACGPGGTGLVRGMFPRLAYPVRGLFG
jgi:hypothetical protein